MAAAPRPEPAALPSAGPAATAGNPAAVVEPATSLSIRFTRTFRQYQRGDRCGFPVAYAEQLITKGVAVLDGTVERQFGTAVNNMIRK